MKKSFSKKIDKKLFIDQKCKRSFDKVHAFHLKGIEW